MAFAFIFSDPKNKMDKAMRELMSLANRYSIYDYRNLCAILGVNPDGRKQVLRSKRAIGASPDGQAASKDEASNDRPEMLAAAGGR
jgi:hypothetical protein